jgi:hypothetical protein
MCVTVVVSWYVKINGTFNIYITWVKHCLTHYVEYQLIYVKKVHKLILLTMCISQK